jgi:hypothetical protein
MVQFASFLFLTQPRLARAALLVNTYPSPSSPTQTQRMVLLRSLCGSSEAGLPQKCAERTYVVEGDLLEVPAKRRRSPRPATPNAPDISESESDDPPPHPRPRRRAHFRVRASESESQLEKTGISAIPDLGGGWEVGCGCHSDRSATF